MCRCRAMAAVSIFPLLFSIAPAETTRDGDDLKGEKSTVQVAEHGDPLWHCPPNIDETEPVDRTPTPILTLTGLGTWFLPTSLFPWIEAVVGVQEADAAALSLDGDQPGRRVLD